YERIADIYTTSKTSERNCSVNMNNQVMALLSQPTVVTGVAGRVGAVLRVGFGQHRGQIITHGSFREVQASGDVGVTRAGLHLTKDLAFPIRQRVGLPVPRRQRQFRVDDAFTP